MITLLYGILSAPVDFQSCAGMWPTQYNLKYVSLYELLSVYEETIFDYGPNSTAVSLQFTKLLNGTWDVIMWKTFTKCVYSFNLLCIDYIELENEHWKLFACMQTSDKQGNVCPYSYNNVYSGYGNLDVKYIHDNSNIHYEHVKNMTELHHKTAHFIGKNKSNVFFRNNMCGDYSDTYYSDKQFSFKFDENCNVDVWTRYCPLNIVHDTYLNPPDYK